LKKINSRWWEGNGIIIPVTANKLEGVAVVVFLDKGTVAFDEFELSFGGLFLWKATSKAKDAEVVRIVLKNGIDLIGDADSWSGWFLKVGPREENGFDDGECGNKAGKLKLIDCVAGEKYGDQNDREEDSGGDAHEGKPILTNEKGVEW